MSELIYWIWLSLSVTPDTTTFKKLIEVYPDAKAIYDADIYEISKHIGSRTSDRARLAQKELSRASEIFDYCIKNNIGLIPYYDERFPQSLRDIKTPPVLLYYRGKFPDFNNSFSIAVVGTRSLSDYGRKAAFSAGYDMACAGAIVVSGMAMGIDGVAHAGALSAGGVTVAVIGTGINICFPEDHIKLAREIVKEGCVITEFPPNTPPSRTTFPKRNRIISGLSAATLVIEGKERSGSLITARHAYEQGRAVYALPGNVGTKNSEATNLLIKNGAKLYTSADDIIRDFESTCPGKLNPFLLSERNDIDILGELTKYSVSATAPGDDIFPSYAPVKKSKRERGVKEVSVAEPQVLEEISPISPPSSDFDKIALSVYKKIPVGEGCLIEELEDETLSLRQIMNSLLKLELGGFVQMLPGERVKRK